MKGGAVRVTNLLLTRVASPPSRPGQPSAMVRTRIIREFCIVNVDRRERYAWWGTLREWLFSGSCSELLDDLRIPVMPAVALSIELPSSSPSRCVQDTGCAWGMGHCG